MIRFPLKYILLTLFAIITLFGVHPTVPLLKSYLAAAVIPLVLIYLLKLDLVYLLILWFFLLLFKFAALPLPMLPDIFPHRLVWILIFGIFGFDLIFKKRERMLPFTGLDAAMIMFSILCIFSMSYAGTFYTKEEGLTINFFLNAYGIPFSIFFITKNIVNDEKKIKKIFIFLAIVGLYLGLTGIFEHFKMSYLVFPSDIMNPNEGFGYGRSRGPFLNPGVNGTVIGIIIFTTIYLLLCEKIKWKKYFFIITLGCMLTTLLFTLTRACWLAFFCAILMASIFIPQVRRIVIPAVLILVIIAVTFLQFSQLTYDADVTETELHAREAPLYEMLVHRIFTAKTIEGRMSLFNVSMDMFFERPLLGNGYGTFIKSKDKYLSKEKKQISSDMHIQKEAQSHNTSLSILVDLGLVGFSLFYFIMFYIIGISRKLYIKLSEETFRGRDLSVIFTGIVIIFLLNIQTIEMRYFLFPNSLFFLIVGIMVGLDQRNHSAKQLQSNNIVLSNLNAAFK